MDDVFIYYAHTLFLLSFVCVGMRITTSTSIEHELAKWALESIILVSSNSNSARIPFTCYASIMLKKFSSIRFLCKHVDDFCDTCDIHAPMILNIDALCVATYTWNDFSSFYFVCNHIAILIMTCHMCSLIWARRRRWSPISGLHQDEGSSLLIGTPGRPTIWNNLV
jgi:hypothetical protein